MSIGGNFFMNTDLLSTLRDNMQGFSKGQKAIARFILEHYDKAAFMTAVKLGNAVGTSESTVVRFAYETGYDGYPKLQKALQELVRNKLTSMQRIAISDDRYGNEDSVRAVMDSDIDNIKATLNEIDMAAFEGAVGSILSAKRIYILGVRSSSSLASFLSFYFNFIFDNVKLISSNTASEVFEQILKIGEDDVLIGISFPRYSKRTVKAMQYAHDQKSHVIAITDSPASPIARYADHSLFARSNMASFVDSLTAPLSVINALIVSVGMKRREDIYQSFEKLEHIWDEYEVYEKINEV